MNFISVYFLQSSEIKKTKFHHCHYWDFAEKTRKFEEMNEHM